MNPRHGLVFAAVGLLAAALTAGCAATPPVAANPLLLESDCDSLLAAAERVLRDHRFEIGRRDPAAGEIATEPLTGKQMWEWWRTDAVGLYNELESSAHTLLRTVEARVYPARDEQGRPLPGRAYLEVRAYTERLSVPEREVTAASQLPSSYSSGRGLVDALAVEQGAPAGQHRVFVRRDSRLEDLLIQQIAARAVRPLPPATQPGDG